MPQNEGQFRLNTDASNEAIGAVLSQVQDGEERGGRLCIPIAHTAGKELLRDPRE